MSQNLILLPVFAQVALTLLVFAALAVRRSAFFKTTGQGPEDMKSATDGDWDEAASAASRCWKNQFELPILFFAAALFSLVTRNVDLTLFVLAWLFVISRVVQVGAHLTLGPVIVRAIAFGVGLTAVSVMWIVLAVRIFRAGF